MTSTDAVPRWAQRQNRLADGLKSGVDALSIFVSTYSTPLIEILGSHGMTSAIIDLEHGAFSPRELEHMIMACETAGMSALVRVPNSDQSIVTSALDLGAHGIVFPMINTAEDARKAMKTLFYPPKGTRGWGGAHTRLARWQGSHATAQDGNRTATVYSNEYLEKAHNLVSVLLVETTEAVANIDEIVAVDGIDVIGFGLGDYLPEVGFDIAAGQAADQKIYQACKEKGVGYLLSYAKAESMYYPGCLVWLGVDMLLISHHLGELISQTREKLQASAS